MRVVIRMSQSEEAKALPILLRHSAGTVLPDRTYVITEDAARQLRQAGVDFVGRSPQRSTRDVTVARQGFPPLSGRIPRRR